MKPKPILRRVLRRLLWLILLALLTYVGTEQILLAKIRSDIKRVYGDDYAILILHMGGEKHDAPSLWQLLKVVYEYNFTDHYLPEGSAGLTGKCCYLTMQISDNRAYSECAWSFRKFRLIIIQDPDDLIDNLPAKLAVYYRYDEARRIRRRGLWFSGKYFNHPSQSFYN